MTWLAVAAPAVCAYALVRVIAHRRREQRLLAACHEIRGPLTAAGLALHARARRGELAPTAVASVELELRRAALALDDLLGARHAEASVVDLGALLSCQAATWADVAGAHGARLQTRIAADGALVKGDGLRLAQAVGNVLANAIEHGGGVIELSSRLDGDRVLVEVTDGGCGLPAPVADLVAGSRRRGTRGLGLSIAARAVERQGGSLRALPSPRGARLALELPLAGEA